MPQDTVRDNPNKAETKDKPSGSGVFASKCGWRGKANELVDGKCPRSGGPVVETLSPALRLEAYEKFDGLSYEDYEALQEKDKAEKDKAEKEKVADKPKVAGA